MRREITIRFYGVQKLNKNDPSLVNVLQAIFDKPHSDRKIDCSGTTLRLEHLHESDGRLYGEISRIQADDFPSEVTGTGRQALATENDLGHSIIFCFDSRLSVMAIRSDKTPVSPSKLESYLSIAHPGAAFHLRPKMRKDAWNNFQAKPLRKFSVTLAGFSDLKGLDGDAGSAFQGLSRFSDAYNNHTITVTLSMGHKKGFLDNSIKRLAAALFDKQDDDFEIRSMKATPSSETIERAEEINLLDQVLGDRESVELPRNDPDKSFEIVCSALRRALLRNKDNL